MRAALLGHTVRSPSTGAEVEQMTHIEHQRITTGAPDRRS